MLRAENGPVEFKLNVALLVMRWQTVAVTRRPKNWKLSISNSQLKVFLATLYQRKRQRNITGRIRQTFTVWSAKMICESCRCDIEWTPWQSGVLNPVSGSGQSQAWSGVEPQQQSNLMYFKHTNDGPSESNIDWRLMILSYDNKLEMLARVSTWPARSCALGATRRMWLND